MLLYFPPMGTQDRTHMPVLLAEHAVLHNLEQHEKGYLLYYTSSDNEIPLEQSQRVGNKTS